LSWWNAEGRAVVIQLLAERWRGPTASEESPYLSEAEAIGDLALYGGASAEDVIEILTGFSADAGVTPDPQGAASAAAAVSDWIGRNEPC
jgi:hypothetical protein